MKRKPNPKDQPERRRGLVEINLIGQKGTRPPKSASQKSTRRRGCVQIFGVLSILGAAAVWLVVSIGPR